MNRPPMSHRKRTRTRRFFSVSPVFLLFSSGLFLAVFWNVLFGNQQFMYRDESHFLFPLYQYVQAELEAGRFPLWTPYDNIGQPFFANAAVGILYPGKLIFFLPLSYPLLYTVYIAGHVLIATWTMYRLARYWGISDWGATLGALSYGFAGTVLGQYCGVVFLLGAAWAPEAVHQGDLMLTRRSFRRALLCAAVLSIMLLGGEPQAAFQVGMILSLLALFRWLRERRLRARSPRHDTVPLRRQSMFSKLLRNRAVLLGVVAGTTFLFSAVQILPSQEYSKLCNRTGFKNPRSVWEVPRFLMAEEKDLAKDEILFDDSAVETRRAADMVRLTRWQRVFNGIFHEGKLDGHQTASYNFSEHPIQWTGFLWPGIEGQAFPQNTNWIGSVVRFTTATNWFVSLYMGIVPFLLAVVSLRFGFMRKSANVRIAWLSWVFLLCLWASMGIYGLGWLLISLRLPNTIPVLNFTINSAVGGGYWFLQTFVPGYIQFRYPAKLLTLAAFPIAMLAAYGFDRVCTAFQMPESSSVNAALGKVTFRRFRRLALFLIFLSVLLMIPTSMRDQWYALAQRLGSGDTGGPFVPLLARFYILISLLQTSLVLVGVLLLVRGRSRLPGKTLPILILLIVSVDLYFSSKNILYVGDRDYYTRDASVVWNQIPEEPNPEPIRFTLNLKTLTRWSQESDPNRLADFLTRNRLQAESQYHYTLPRNEFENIRFAKVNESGTMLPYSFAQWIVRNLRNDFRFETNLMTLGVQYALMDASKPLMEELATPIMRGGTPETPPDWPENAVLWKLHDPKNRVWIERDGRETAEPNEATRIVRYEPSRVDIEVELDRPGTVVLSDQYWPGWHVEVVVPMETLAGKNGESVAKEIGTIRPVNDIFRGVDLPGGVHRLIYRYAPDSFRTGATISAIAWTFFVIVLLAGRLRFSRKTRK